MNTWAPLFNKIVHSSLWVEPLHVRVLFLTMLAMKDKDDIVRYNPFNLARLANITQEQVAEGIEVLSNPDTQRDDDQQFEGRRIKKVQEGYLILNGAKYRSLMKREYNAQRQREHRAKLKSEGLLKPNRLPGETSYLTAQAAGATEETLDSIVSGSLPEEKA